MKKLVVMAFLSAAVATSVSANPNGGFNGGFAASAQAVSSVSQLSSMKDDQYVVLQGNIVKQVGGEDYLFRDTSGEVVVEIDHENWAGVNVTPSDEVRVYGEVDQSWHKTEVEIHRVEKVQ